MCMCMCMRMCMWMWMCMCMCMCMCMHTCMCMCARSDSAQFAGAFNQPLSSFDTSKVTDMSGMFRVRSARALTPHKP
jgi:surface protein